MEAIDYEPLAFPNERIEICRRTILAYSTGHVMNDMCSTCWFAYILIFLEHNVKLTSPEAGIVMLCGQVADALTTPLVGIYSDKTQGWPHLGLGRRKLWHLCGSLLVAVCFSLVWVVSPTCDKHPASRFVLIAYYSIAASLFNVGWASVQVSHMCLVPELSSVDGDRVSLNSARYAALVASNSSVYLLMALWTRLFSVHDAFSYTAISTLVLGGIATILFQCFTPCPIQPRYEDHQYPLPLQPAWKSWLAEPMLYSVAMVYMCTRLVANLTQVYLPFFATTTLGMDPYSIITLPLVMYLGSFGSTFGLRHLNATLGRKGGYCAGACLSLLAFLCLFLLTPSSSSVLVYLIGLLLGLGNATIMVSSISMESDLVGHKCESGAFVFGALSFCDKLSGGLVVMWIQSRKEQSESYVRFVFCIVTTICLLCALLLTAVVRLPPAVDTLGPAVMPAPHYEFIQAEEDDAKENEILSPKQV